MATLIVFILLSIACVSAADGNQTLSADNVENTDTISIENDLNVKDLESSCDISDTLNVEEKEEQLTAGKTWYVNSSAQNPGDGTPEHPYLTLWNALQSCGDGDTIMIASGYYTNDTNIEKIIDKNNLHIIKYGEGEAIFDAVSHARFLIIRATTIHIDGLTFINGNDPAEGGALYFENDVKDSTINAIFQNNKAGWNGGALYFKKGIANSTISGKFINNTAELDGGAVYITGNIEDTTISGEFINNTAESNGGALYFDSHIADSTINGEFRNNSARYCGGAIYVGITTRNCTMNARFYNNKVTVEDRHYGGAVIFHNDVSNSILNITANSNIADDGGAILFYFDFTDSILTGNFTGNYANRIGGANCFGSNVRNVTITATFTNNQAGTFGGANYFLGNVDNVNITGTFHNNYAYGIDVISHRGGGANQFLSNLTDVNIAGNFTNNYAPNGYGGANNFCGLVDGVNITGIFMNNQAKENGGANYFNNNTTDLHVNGNFKNNYATNGSGGANSFCGSVAGASIIATFINNQAKENGGANYFMNTTDSVEISGNYINNTAANGSANYFNDEATDLHVNGNFTNNTANDGNGAALYIKFIFDSEISGIFVNNTGENLIYTIYCGRNVKIHDSIFLNEKNTIEGNGITVTNSWFGSNSTNYKTKPCNGYVTLDDWLFLSATANPYVLTDLSPSEIVFRLFKYDSNSRTITQSNLPVPFDFNISSANGEVDKKIVKLGEPLTFTPADYGIGSITATHENIANTFEIEILKNSFEELQNIINNAEEGSTITLKIDYSYNEGFTGEGILIDKNLTIDGNGHTLDAEGKCRIFKISSYDDINVTLKNINFVNGHVGSTDYGGAVFINDQEDKVISVISNCSFVNNTAYNGGAVDLYVCKNIHILDCHFENNTATLTGGGVCEQNCHNCTISNCNFVNNSAGQFGGAIRANSGRNNSIIDCNFTDNKVTGTMLGANQGGAVDEEVSDSQIIGCNFKNNIGPAGSAAYLQGNNNSVSNCTFINNKMADNADKGGAIYWNGENGQISDCVFINNTNNMGGAIYYTSNTNTVSNSTFINNSAVKGGAIYKGNATNCVFEGNNAYQGGAMYEGTADSCIFKTTEDTCEGTTILSPILKVENSTFTYKSGEKFTFNLTTNSGMPIANANISISVYHKDNNTWVGNYSCLSGDGWIVDLPHGTYLAVFNTEYAGFTPVNATVTVNRGNSTLTVPDITFDYGTTGSATVTFTNAIGIIAEVIGHSDAIVTVKDNVITVSNLSAGTYTLNVTTLTDDNYNNVSETAKITVNKLNSEITAANKAYVINYGGAYSVTLKNADGNAITGQKVTFTLNGKNIGTATTNAQGVASIQLTAAILKTAKAGTKNLVVKFEGDAIYNEASKTVKITINKEKTKIVAKKKTFKKSLKVKKYTATLKNSKNKPIKKVQVTLKVKGKTYKAKTNTKGKAVFKIKNLKKKGTFKATIKFKGNNYYKAATKKVKIKIK